MVLVRCLALVMAALLTWGAQGFALTDTLEELIREKGIIMPDLAQRYPDAEAVIILDEKQVDQSRIINPVYISRHVVVKILKESAIEKFRTVKLPFYQEVKVSDLEARTINDGSIVEVRDIPERKPDLAGQDADFIFPLEQCNTMFAVRSVEVDLSTTPGDLLVISDNPVFHKKGADVWRIRQIDFPEVRVGSVLEYYYRVEQKRVVMYDRFFLQNEKYPVLKSSYQMRNANMLRFIYEPNNFITKPEWVLERRFTNLESQYNNDLRTKMRTIDVTDKPENWQFYGHQFFHVQMDTLDAYPADLPFAPAYRAITPRVDVIMREAVNLWQKGPKDIRIRTESFSPNWNYPVHRLSKSTIMDQRRSRRAKEQIAEVIKDAAGPQEKVDAAVKWARENFKASGELGRWESFFWGCLPKDPDRMLRNGDFNAADIVTFLVNALSLNDLFVYPAYAKSRNRGQFLNRVFMETQFDVPLVALESGRGRFKFWQASTDVPLPVDYIDHSLEGTKVLVNTSGMDDVSYNMVTLPSTPSEQNRSVINAALTLGEDGSATGSLQQELTGHLSARQRRKLAGVAEGQRGDLWKESLSGKFAAATLGGATRLDDPSVLKPKYAVNADLSLANVGRAVAGGLAVNSSIITDPYSSALSGEQRRFGVVFPHLAEFSSSIELKVPAGFAMPDSLPEPVELKTRGIYYQRVLARKGEDTMLIKREFKVTRPLLQARAYNRRYASIFAKIQQTDAMEIVLPKR